MSVRHGGQQNDGLRHEDERLTGYVLGTLDPAERAEVEHHTAECPECRRELAELAEMQRFLGEVPPEAFLEGPPEGGDLLLQRTLRQVRAEGVRRDRRRWAATGAAAVVAAAALLGAGVAVGRSGSPAPEARAPAVPAPAGGVRTASVTDPATGARLTVAVAPAAGWVRVSAAVTGVRAGEDCRLVVMGRDGRKEVAGGWKVSPAAQSAGTSLTGSASMAPADVAAVAVETAAGRRLVTAALES
ncbi:zf-HC2 domain-containing protein [Streptacidiphilus sp. ASG 303]|uniref:anti-sigma factor family protein n=1 Tax=Streptacidiphilus sp. ASG 303 TaxID=2896847 RepID=UPI001E3FEFA9|nr:zf-HC2 domain-containing protein [Streptacidiphilus sp. ASG 303]MCD0486362.1 zf-HC2 domain-containing protein [Streptacidiphilus sp. ASG 303]